MVPSESDSASCDEQQPSTTPAGEDVERSAASPTDAAAPRDKTARGFVVSWKQANYYVPNDAVVSLPKTPFKVDDGHALGALLATKCAEKWLPICKPEHLLMLKGKEGTAVYAVFSVDDHPNEDRYIRLIPGAVAAKNFPKIIEAIESNPNRAMPQNARQKRRFDVLLWKPSDCSAPQIDPKYNDWAICGEEGLKSCVVSVPRPASKRAFAGESQGIESSDCSGGGAHLPRGIKFIRRVVVGQDGSYLITQRPGAVFITQFAESSREPVEA